MVAKTKKIPDKLRITLKENRDSGRWDFVSQTWIYSGPKRVPLGFSNAYEPHTKAYEKRAETQDKWAYNSYEIRPLGKVYEIKGKWVQDPKSARGRTWQQEIFPVALEFQPIIIDNVAMSGFKLVESVERYSTSNKVWRVLDPRGFELEISTNNLEELILGGDISKGEIIGPCIWRTPKILERV